MLFFSFDIAKESILREAAKGITEKMKGKALKRIRKRPRTGPIYYIGTCAGACEGCMRTRGRTRGNGNR